MDYDHHWSLLFLGNRGLGEPALVVSPDEFDPASHPHSNSPPQGGEDKSLPPRWGNARMGVTGLSNLGRQTASPFAWALDRVVGVKYGDAGSAPWQVGQSLKDCQPRATDTVRNVAFLPHISQVS